jgi:hypothetical protein
MCHLLGWFHLFLHTQTILIRIARFSILARSVTVGGPSLPQGSSAFARLGPCNPAPLWSSQVHFCYWSIEWESIP